MYLKIINLYIIIADILKTCQTMYFLLKRGNEMHIYKSLIVVF